MKFVILLSIFSLFFSAFFFSYFFNLKYFLFENPRHPQPEQGVDLDFLASDPYFYHRAIIKGHDDTIAFGSPYTNEQVKEILKSFPSAINIRQRRRSEQAKEAFENLLLDEPEDEPEVDFDTFETFYLDAEKYMDKSTRANFTSTMIAKSYISPTRYIHGHVYRLLSNPVTHFSIQQPLGGCGTWRSTPSENARSRKCLVATNAGFFNVRRRTKRAQGAGSECR